MSALKPSERAEVSVFNKAGVLGEFPLFFHTSKLCVCGQDDPLVNGDDCEHHAVDISSWKLYSRTSLWLLFELIHRHNRRNLEFFFAAPLPVRLTDRGLLLQMGYCSGLQQSCFHPLQYYRRSYLIPNNQLIHCPWRRGHLCTGNLIPVACLSLPFPLVSTIFFFFPPLCLNSEHRQTASVYLGHQLDHIWHF